MAGIDDNISIIGDWIPPTQSPRTFFTVMLGDDSGSKQVSKAPLENKSEGLFLGENSDKMDVNQGCEPSNESTFEQKSSTRAGLLERMAARAGFNAPRLNTENIRSTDTSLNPEIRSPYLTIPPGLSPTTLLESPVFVSNSLAQPSPTTGKFSFIPNVNDRSCIPESRDKSEDNYFEDINASSFAFKPIAESNSSFLLGAMSKVTPASLPQQSFSNIEVSVQSENSQPSRSVDPRKLQQQNSNMLSLQADFLRSSTEKDTGSNNSADQRVFDPVGGSVEHSLPLDEPQDEEGDQRVSGDCMAGGAPSEDGYNWRKYGQKQVKGSEYPRSYYKCTHPTCQVKKKVERSHEGHITEIIYKGAHNHPKPPPNRRSSIGSSNPLIDMQLELPEQTGLQNGTDGEPVWATAQKGTVAATHDWTHENIEMTSSATICPENGTAPTPNGTHIESGDAVDASSTFSNDEDEDDRGTHGSVSLGYDGEGDESESKRRKIEAYTTEMSGATRAIREPRVVVQTTSEVDILDDGYRWRKYGQKVVKGNPNPRSYYKCTSAGCTVRKHVERASHDLKSVITTYEGKHNHDVPAARNSSHVNSATSNTATALTSSSVQTHAHRSEPSQLHNSMVRPTSFGPFTLPGRQQLGPSPGFSFGMNQPGLANLAMAGLGPGQPKMPVLPLHPYMPHQRQGNEMGFRLPKGEAKMEPMSDPGLDLSNNTSVYQQLMSRLPLGPQNVTAGSTLAPSGSVSEQFYGSQDTSPAGDNRYRVIRPLQHDKWSKGKDGFLITDIWGVDVGGSDVTTPIVWLQHTEERMYLCAYQYKSLTLILLIPLSSILNGEQGVSAVKQQLLENASLKILKVEEKLSKGWGGENAYHVSGYRYLIVDGNRDISRASPPAKVTTLTKESLLALNRLREEVDAEKSRSKWDNPGRDKDLEVSIRAKNNAWAIARITGGKELYMVLEKANETLLYASDAVEKFSNRYCSGAFSLD